MEDYCNGQGLETVISFVKRVLHVCGTLFVWALLTLRARSIDPIPE